MFWEIFQELCQAMSKSPSAICKELGFSNATATHWKNGTIPNGEALIKIADFFNISTDYLLGRTDDPNSHKKRPILTIENEPRYLIKRAGRDGKMVEEYLTAAEIDELKKQFKQLPEATDL